MKRIFEAEQAGTSLTKCELISSLFSPRSVERSRKDIELAAFSTAGLPEGGGEIARINNHKKSNLELLPFCYG